MKKQEKTYGIVEGFFSEPLPIWSETERLQTIDFVAKEAKSINSYIYCPKDDPYVTKKYDLLYPEAEIKKMARLIEGCNSRGIEFMYGLNPSIEGSISPEVIKQNTMRKIDQMVSAGCKNVMLLFDDIPLAYDVVEGKVKVNNGFEKVIQMVNEIYEETRGKMQNFWFCGPDYCFRKESPVTMATKELNKEIGIIWSGNGIFSKTISLSDIGRVKSILGQDTKIIFWSNYPVNDCEQAKGTFNLGGFYPIEEEVVKLLGGVIVNPMRECMANLPFYMTFSDWIEDKNYERSNSYLRGMRKVLGIKSSMGKTLMQMASRNIADNELGIAWGALKMETSVKNKYGKLFLEAIKPLLEDIEGWKNILETITKRGKVKANDFEKVDWFPTKTYVSRYLPEIVRIINSRKKLYSRDLPLTMTRKYKGSENLSISKGDTKKYLRVIKRIISDERKDFLAFINDKRVTVEKRLRTLGRRRCVNRFTMNELE